MIPSHIALACRTSELPSGAPGTVVDNPPRRCQSSGDSGGAEVRSIIDAGDMGGAIRMGTVAVGREIEIVGFDQADETRVAEEQT